jgi:hypothetical protein
VWLLGGVLAGSLGCDGQDTTTLTGAEQVEGSPLEPGVGESQTISVLTSPESTDVICRWIGVSSRAGGGGDDGCADVVEQCRDGARAVLGSEAAAITVPDGDLQDLLGCPVSYADLDACIGTALERGVMAYGEQIGCDEPAPPPLETAALFASPECIAVVLFCPQLVESLIEP